MAVRDKVLEAAADLVPLSPPETLVNSETRRRVDDLANLEIGDHIEQFDTPASLGENESGAQVAAPIWHDYMDAALKVSNESSSLNPEHGTSTNREKFSIWMTLPARTVLKNGCRILFASTVDAI